MAFIFCQINHDLTVSGGWQKSKDDQQKVILDLSSVSNGTLKKEKENQIQVSISSTLYERLLHQYICAKKLISHFVTREKLDEALLYEKLSCKTLLKLTTGVNFTSITRAAFEP